MNFKHDPPLALELVKELLPIYNDLSREDLLERCLGKYTQNSNESLNACIWHLAPKHLHCGSKMVEIATFLSSGIFNEGYYTVLKVMNIMGIRVGPACKAVADAMNNQRLNLAHHKSQKWPGNDINATNSAQPEDFYEEHEPFHDPEIAD